MALIKCPDCGKEISENAPNCPNCGSPIASKPQNVCIRFPVWKGQMLNNSCYVYNYETNEVIASGKQGETVSFLCPHPIEIYIVVKGAFGKPKVTVKAGDKYNVAYRGFGKIYMEKVDMLTGGAIMGNFNF